MSTDRNPVVWFEGMSLDPHHFQQWDRSHRSAVRRRLEAVAPDGWGVREMSLDDDRLRNGEIVVRTCTALFPDGLHVEIPAIDPPPAPRSFRDALSPADGQIRVYLAVPSVPTGPPVGPGPLPDAPDAGVPAARTVRETIRVPDANTGADPRPIDVARVNAQIRWGEESLDGFTALPLADIERAPDGGFRRCPAFVPPVLRLSASRRLRQLVEQVLGRLVERRRSLAQHVRTIQSQCEVLPSDAVALGLLHVVAAALPGLRHHHDRATAHPLTLYLDLARLSEGLAAFAPEGGPRPTDLPGYDHRDLTPLFAQLSRRLDKLLGETVLSRPYESMPLVAERDRLFTAKIPASRLARADLYLVARTAEEGGPLPDALPDLLRVAAPQAIDAVLKSYTRALPVQAAAAPPLGVPALPDARYYRLVPREPFWSAIQESEALAVFVPEGAGALDLQVLLVASRAGGEPSPSGNGRPARGALSARTPPSA